MKLLKLQAEWCGPCKNLTQWMQNINLPYEVSVVDIDDNPNAAAEYGIRGIPAVVLVNEDNSVVKSATGFEPSRTLLQELVA